MSIRDRLKELEDSDPAGVVRIPGARPKSAKRVLFLGSQAMHEFANPQSASNFWGGRGNILAAFVRWVNGDRVWRNGIRGGFLDSLHPPPSEVFELRIIAPSSHVRALGMFGAPNALVLLRLHTRGSFRTPEDWEREMIECVADWDRLFPDDPPFRGNTIGDYVTEECDDFPLKFVRP